MKTLIVYDDHGYVVSNITSGYRLPVGIPYLEVEIPEGKQLKRINGIGVDVSVTPHQAILEDIPKTDVQILKERQDATEDALLDLLLGGM